jgi:hypothetical protein
MMSTLRRLCAPATVVVAALAVSACMKQDEKTTLAKDGSGTVSMTVTMDTSKMKELKEMFSAMMPAPEAPAPTTPTTPGMEGEPAMEGEPPAPKKEDSLLPDDFKKEQLEKELATQPGLKLEQYEVEKTDTTETVKLKISFTSWENLCKAGAAGSKAVTLTKAEDGTYTIAFDSMGGQDMGGEGAQGAEMMLPMLEPFLSGMEMKMAITLPGAITETNGTKSEDGLTASWSMGWKDMVAAMKEKKKDAMTAKVSFKGEGIDLKPFTFKPDASKMAGKAGFGPK